MKRTCTPMMVDSDNWIPAKACPGRFLAGILRNDEDADAGRPPYHVNEVFLSGKLILCFTGYNETFSHKNIMGNPLTESISPGDIEKLESENHRST